MFVVSNHGGFGERSLQSIAVLRREQRSVLQPDQLVVGPEDLRRRVDRIGNLGSGAVVAKFDEPSSKSRDTSPAVERGWPNCTTTLPFGSAAVGGSTLAVFSKNELV
jgi:hypothetical protein